jgi:hypothetical protein
MSGARGNRAGLIALAAVLIGVLLLIIPPNYSSEVNRMDLSCGVPLFFDEDVVTREAREHRVGTDTARLIGAECHERVTGQDGAGPTTWGSLDAGATCSDQRIDGGAMTEVEDQLAIMTVIARHGHLVDDGELERLGEILAEDVSYDVSDLGGGVLTGLPAIIEASLALGAANPVAHLVTNTVIDSIDGDRATARSKGLGVNSDGSLGTVTVTYLDDLHRTDGRWLITRRTVLARRVPLGGRTASAVAPEASDG